MPRLLDLFCGAGGCAVGYSRAGFDEIVGVDLHPQKRYPFEFVQADALEYLAKHGHKFDAIHASPPCQRYSSATRCNKTRPDVKTAEDHPDLVDPARQLLKQSGRPYVIENVMQAPLHNAVMLCGTMFRLKVLRHRLFESSFYIMAPGQRCWHPPKGTIGKAGVRGKRVGDWISVAGSTDLKVASPAMGITWMKNRREIAQSIPPAYTEYIGKQLIAHLEG